MTSPLCGTLVPAAGGRTELQGIGVQSYSIGWYTRSNFGGRSLAINLYEKSTLESLGLGYVADELEKGGKLGGM